MQYTLGLTRLIGHGHAFTEVVPVANPAAGQGVTYTTSRYWEVIDLIAFRLVSNGNAANRQVVLTIKDGGGTALATLPAASVQIASKTYDYTWSTEFSNFNTLVGAAITSPLPYTLLQPGFSVVVSVGAIDAGDQISNIRLSIERFVTGSEGYLLGVVEADSPRVIGAVDAATLLA